MPPSPESLPSTLWAELRALICPPAAHLLCLVPCTVIFLRGYFQLSLIRQGLCLVHCQCQVCNKYSFSVSWIRIIESHLVELQPEHLQTDITSHLQAWYFQRSRGAENLPFKPTLLGLGLNSPWSLSHSYLNILNFDSTPLSFSVIPF